MGGAQINPVDVVANVATGGLYGAGEALSQGKIGSAAENLGPWGAAVHPISPQVADIGNALGAGAGIGGGLASQGTGAFNPSVGFGADAAQTAPFYAGYSTAAPAAYGPEGLPLLTDPAGNAAYNVSFDPVTGVAGPGSGIPPSQIAGLSAGGVAGAAGGGGGGALTGAALAQQALGFLGGASPLNLPQGGALGPGGQPGALTPQQVAALSAMQDEAHRGLAPDFGNRMGGRPQSPGIAGANFTA